MTIECKPQATASPEELILTMYGIRGPESDPMPALTVQHGDGQYVGEFINDFNEVFVIWIDRRTKTGWVAGHRTGWEKLPIQDNRMDADILFSRLEAAWIRLCWFAATYKVLALSETDALDRALKPYRQPDGTVIFGPGYPKLEIPIAFQEAFQEAPIHSGTAASGEGSDGGCPPAPGGLAWDPTRGAMQRNGTPRKG